MSLLCGCRKPGGLKPYLCLMISRVRHGQALLGRSCSVCRGWVAVYRPPGGAAVKSLTVPLVCPEPRPLAGCMAVHTGRLRSYLAALCAGVADGWTCTWQLRTERKQPCNRKGNCRCPVAWTLPPLRCIMFPHPNGQRFCPHSRRGQQRPPQMEGALPPGALRTRPGRGIRLSFARGCVRWKLSLSSLSVEVAAAWKCQVTAHRGVWSETCLVTRWLPLARDVCPQLGVSLAVLEGSP